MSPDTTPDSQGPSQLTQQVVEHVRALITSGEVRPGDRLPPERELARRLNISRPSLRAGIGFLSAMGVLQSRHGAGTFVADGPPALDSRSFSVLGSLHNVFPWQMFEARLVLETGLAALAAERATDHHIAALAEEVLEMEAALADPQEYLIHDVRFHRGIAQAAGNPVLATFMETITAAFYNARRATVQNSTEHLRADPLHREIYRAIRARNPARARDAMQRHLTTARLAYEQETGDLGPPADPHATSLPATAEPPRRRQRPASPKPAGSKPTL